MTIMSSRLAMISLARGCGGAIVALLIIQCVPVRAMQASAEKAQGMDGVVSTDDAATHIRSGAFTLSDTEAIASAPKEVRAAIIPVLERQFRSSQDMSAKGKIASSLIRLGDRGDTYWNYLTAQAIQAADDDVPYPFGVDQGGRVSDALAPQFLQWAVDRHLSTSQAIERAVFTDPAAVSDLGYTGDARAVSILQKALFSANFYVEVAAAEALANLRDTNSVPLIIEACSKAPAQVAELIALPLAYFDDKSAQAAFELYVSRQAAADERRARSDGLTPYGLRVEGGNHPQ